MADSKAQDLVKRVFSSLADLTGVRLWSGKTGESDALGVEVPELLSSDAVTGATVDYKALTPKGFYSSVGGESTLGIHRLATTAEIQAKSTTGVIPSLRQGIMQYEWQKDWFIANGTPAIPIQKNIESLASGGAVIFNSTYAGSFAAGGKIALNPSVNGASFESVAIQYSITVDSLGSIGHYSGFVTLDSVGGGSEVTVAAGAYGAFYITAGGGEFGFKATLASNHKIACSVTGTVI